MALNAQSLVGIIAKAIDDGTAKTTLASTLNCKIGDLSEFIRLNIPDKLDAFLTLPLRSVDQTAAAIRERRKARSRNDARRQTSQSVPPSFDNFVAEVEAEMDTVRLNLGIGPCDRVFPALPVSEQQRIRELARQYCAYIP